MRTAATDESSLHSVVRRGVQRK